MKVFMVLVALTGTAVAGELLSGHGQAGFKLGYAATNAEQSIREFVPAGESVQDWSRMITDQRFTDRAKVFRPEAFAAVVAKGLRAGCPGGKAGKIVRFKIAGHAAARMRADCPRNPATGKPETFIMLVIAGSRDLHSRQVAWRRVPSLADINWGNEVLAGTRLCTPDSKSCGG